MAEDVMVEEVRRWAESIGMTQLTDEHLHQLVGAMKAARARRSALRSETLGPSDEPAHVYRLGPEVVR